MCGIVVALMFGKKKAAEEKVRQKVARILTTELLLETEKRGEDATGAAVLFNDGNYYGIKRGEKVSSFIHTFGETKNLYGGFLKLWKETTTPAKVYLGHCRAGTIGEKTDNVNNHPIKIGNIVGIHNGVIRNHEEIFEKLKCKRDGKVDSEAIFRLFDFFTKNGKEPFTLEMIEEVVKRLDGHFAVSLFNADNLNQVPVFRDGRPVEFVLIKNLGILLMVSVRDFWYKVHSTYERLVNYYDTKLPSLLGKGNIVLLTMPDDYGMIFDLTKNVTTDTKLEDLYVGRKIPRTGKIWRQETFTSGKGYGYYGGGGWYHNSRSKGAVSQSKPAEEKSTKEDENVSSAYKRRVFDRITGKYVIKAGDKILDSDSSAVIDIDNNKTEFAIDLKEEKKPTSTAKIEDKTKYEMLEDKAKNSTSEEPKPEDKTNVIDVTAIPVEIVELAVDSYKKLPLKKKGFTDIEDLLDRIELPTERALNTLGHILVANRVFGLAWKEGYKAAVLSNADQKFIDKANKRTKYIETLKRILVYLAAEAHTLKDGNINADLDSMIKEVSSIFNTTEMKLVESIASIKKE